jgi:hypothetical protein
MGTRSFVVIILLVFSIYSVALSQDSIPDPVRIYRSIELKSDTRAGDIRWIEIWETQDQRLGDREWVMIDLQGGQNGIDETCHHAIKQGSGAPIYLVNGDLVPIDSAETLFSEIENRRLVDQGLIYVEEYSDNFDEITDLGEEEVNGVLSRKRRLFDEDATNLFLVLPPATSTALLWTAIDGDFVTRYLFEATGSTGSVSHRYELLPGGAVVVDEKPELQCFDGGFPTPNLSTSHLSGNLTYQSYASELSTQELQLFYDEALTPMWEPSPFSGVVNRFYTREFEDGTVCNLGIRFEEGNDRTIFTASAVPTVVGEDAFSQITDDLASPIFIQSASNVTFSIEGTVQEAIEQVLPDFEDDGWILRDQLTDIRDDSAFITVRNGLTETHITVDRIGENAVVRLQQREPVCGPTFPVSESQPTN